MKFTDTQRKIHLTEQNEKINETSSDMDNAFQQVITSHYGFCVFVCVWGCFWPRNTESKLIVV